MVRIGRIGAAHGIAGAVRVKAFTAEPVSLGDYGSLSTADGRKLRIRALRPAGSVVVVQFEGIGDRTAAETLNGIDLYVPRDRLPAPEAEEYYHADLIGLGAFAADGTEIGTVIGVANYGAGDLIEIARTKGSAVLVPFTRANVPKIDLAARRLIVDPLPGLLD
jgi:16S rRNA processing protein RimM